jgi:hypothetical protein
MVREGREHSHRDGMATTDSMACEYLEKVRSKISTMVVGLDFDTTSPRGRASRLPLSQHGGWVAV